MSLADHYDKDASVKRLTIVLDEDEQPTKEKEYATHIASVPCHLQPLNDQTSQDIPGGFGRDLLMLSDIVDIAEGDRVTIDEEEYRVMATEALDFGLNPHRETTLRIFKSS
jgi:hypothetical protein